MSLKLEVISGPLLGKEFKFSEHDVFLFGRSPDCHCCLSDDPYISRHHFMLEVSPPEAQIRDLGSLNGTYINDIKYGGREKDEVQKEAADRTVACRIKSGDLIMAGKTTMKVALEDEEGGKVIAECFKCGKVIPDSKKDELAYIGGTFLCRECRKKMASPPAPSEKEELERSKAKALKYLFDAVFGGARKAVQKISGYEIIRKLGEGGFGEVYLVRRCSDGKELALKIMLSKKNGISQRDIKRFQREMKICLDLKHPYIVSFEEQGIYNNLFYFTMEYCSGGDLGRLIISKGGYIDIKEAVPLMLQIIDGLAYAHKKDIVHRDLKPGNILLDSTHKKAKITDFGLAKNFVQAGLSDCTIQGEYAGTPQFMPKEQISNFKFVAPASDVFSIGATFYYMLTGNFVYDFLYGEDPMRVVLEGRIVPIGRRRNIPKKLAAVINKSISPEMKHRYKSAVEMKRDLNKATR